MSNDIQIGQILDKRFEITGLIERGGMATIFKAIDSESHQAVAIKLPHLEFQGTAKNAARFAREAAIIGKLDHPGIPKIVPVAEKSRPYIVLEYIDGETLYDMLKHTPQFPIPEALQLGSRLCEILDYMHKHHVVHCDIKPGNIMISGDGRPHVIDFGIAKGPMTEPFMLGWLPPSTGTPEYMSPEQIQGGRVDVRTDIYSLGAILHEALTGNINPQVEEIILRAMAPRPSDRYSSAAAMKADLDSPEKVQVTGIYKNPRKASAWPKRLRLAAVILSLAAAPVILFFVFLWIFKRQMNMD